MLLHVFESIIKFGFLTSYDQKQQNDGVSAALHHTKSQCFSGGTQ